MIGSVSGIFSRLSKPMRHWQMFFLCCFLMAGFAWAEGAGKVYEWVDAEGKHHFSDKKPTAGDANEKTVRKPNSGAVYTPVPALEKADKSLAKEKSENR